MANQEQDITPGSAASMVFFNLYEQLTLTSWITLLFSFILDEYRIHADSSVPRPPHAGVA
jgi:hypothetical protein